MKWKETFGSRIVDTIPIVRKAVDAGSKIVLEGQLGIMRDLDWGIYPYTTSSNPTSGGAANVSGISPNKFTDIIGVTKAYSTSVGGGPFTAELFDDSAHSASVQTYARTDRVDIRIIGPHGHFRSGPRFA